jgi:hypothetical protein
MFEGGPTSDVGVSLKTWNFLSEIKVPIRQLQRLRLITAVSPCLHARFSKVPLRPRHRAIETQLRCEDHRPFFNYSYFMCLSRTFPIPRIREKADLDPSRTLNPPNPASQEATYRPASHFRPTALVAARRSAYLSFCQLDIHKAQRNW